MANRIQNIIKAISGFDFKEEQLKIVARNENKLAEFQAEQWSKTSLDKNGEKIKLLDNEEYGYGYTPLTIQLKKKYGSGVGKITNRVTFFKTGLLQETLFARVRKADIVWGSLAPYFKGLMSRAGNPQGLNKEYKDRFRKEIVEPELKKAFYDRIGKL